jgi:hypothetical protein
MKKIMLLSIFWVSFLLLFSTVYAQYKFIPLDIISNFFNSILRIFGVTTTVTSEKVIPSSGTIVYSTVPPINQEPTTDPFIVVQYHSWYFPWSMKNYASYIPIVGGEYQFRDFTDLTIEQHVEWAKQYGIDAFVVSYEPGFQDGERRSKHLSRVADIFEEKGMKWFFFTEAILLSGQSEKDYFLSLYNKYKDYSSYVKVNGKPVVMTYVSWLSSSGDIEEFRNELEPVYLIGDLFQPSTTQPEVYEFCQPQNYNLPTDNVEIWVRMKSLDGLSHSFTEHFVNDETDESLIWFGASTSSTSYEWFKLGSFDYDGTYKSRLSDWSDPNLAVDAIKVKTTYIERIMEAEDVAGGTIIDDPEARNGKAVTRKDEGIYTWWGLDLNHRSPLEDYYPIFDAFSGYNIRVEIDDWSTCISKVYGYFRSRSLPFTGWAGPGFNCKYASWCNFIRPYGPSKEIFVDLLDKAKTNSNWIFICNWNDFMEGTNIEPTEEQGYEFLDALNQI